MVKTICIKYGNQCNVHRLVMNYLCDSFKRKAQQVISHIPAPILEPRSEYFNPVQIIVGTLIMRGHLLPNCYDIYEPIIKRAKLTNSEKQSERHYKLDSEHWYKYWPKTRHTLYNKMQSVKELTKSNDEVLKNYF